MDASRFDTISRLFASRRTRRQALAGSAGIAALTVVPALAQDATPGIDLSDPHPGTDGLQPDVEFLFVQAFTSGAWAPRQDDGTYTLTLQGAPAQTIYFSDRPERIFGQGSTQDFLDGLGFTPDNPPNAALVAEDAAGGQEVVMIELFSPEYDAESATLTYQARLLADYEEAALAHAARQQQAFTVSESLGPGSLFIDDCPDLVWTCYGDMSGENYGSVRVGYCMNSNIFDCHPCRDINLFCMEQLPEYCRKEVVVDGVTSYGNVCHAGPSPF